MAPSRRNTSQRGRSSSHLRGSSRALERSSTASPHRSPLRRLNRPASEWHSAGSQRRTTIASRQFSQRPETEALFLTPVAAPHRQESLVPADPSDGPDESSDHIVMALDIKDRGSIGCAYYVAREERLFCMEDVPKGGLETVDKCKFVPSSQDAY